MVWSLGSVANSVTNRIDNIPSTVSGTELINMAYNAMLFVQDYTGVTIGSNAIPDQYCPAIIDLTAADLLTFMETQGVDTSNWSLGDFSVGKGANSSALSAADKFRNAAMKKLTYVGAAIRFDQVV